MKAVVQRVKSANVKVDNIILGEIKNGLLILIAIANSDDINTIKWFANKLINLRIFPDENDKMNHSVNDIKGELLLISNFTIYGNVHKGFRPNFMESATPIFAEQIFNKLYDFLTENYKLKIEKGRFGAMMDIELINDGPVTIIIER